MDEHMDRQDMLHTLKHILSAAVQNIRFRNEADNLSFAVWKSFAYCTYAVLIIQFKCLMDAY